jgi:hypothetical protein
LKKKAPGVISARLGLLQREAVLTEESHMAKGDKNPSENETILMALDQISQTIDVMTSVVGRLRNYMQQQEAAAAEKNKESHTEMQSDRILH